MVFSESYNNNIDCVKQLLQNSQSCVKHLFPTTTYQFTAYSGKLTLTDSNSVAFFIVPSFFMI